WQTAEIIQQSIDRRLTTAFAFDYMSSDVAAVGAPRQSCRRSPVEQPPAPPFQPSILTPDRSSGLPRPVRRHGLGVVVARDGDVPLIRTARRSLPVCICWGGGHPSPLITRVEIMITAEDVPFPIRRLVAPRCLSGNFPDRNNLYAYMWHGRRETGQRLPTTLRRPVEDAGLGWQREPKPVPSPQSRQRPSDPQRPPSWPGQHVAARRQRFRCARRPRRGALSFLSVLQQQDSDAPQTSGAHSSAIRFPELPEPPHCVMNKAVVGLGALTLDALPDADYSPLKEEPIRLASAELIEGLILVRLDGPLPLDLLAQELSRT